MLLWQVHLKLMLITDSLYSYVIFAGHTDIKYSCTMYEGITLAQWLRFCVTNRKVAGSNPGGVVEIFLFNL